MATDTIITPPRNGNGQSRVILGIFVAMLTAGATWAVSAVLNAPDKLQAKLDAVAAQVAAHDGTIRVLEAQRVEGERWRTEMREEMREGLRSLNEKMDRVLRRNDRGERASQ